MDTLLPVHGDLPQQAPFATSIEAAVAPEQPPAAPAADELDNLGDETYNLDLNLASSLGFPVASVDGGYQRRVLVLGSSKWKDVLSASGTRYRFGVAIRAVITVSAAQVGFDLTLPVVAAKVQLNELSASGQLLIRGYKGNVALPRWESFGVDAYGDYLKSVSAARDQVLADAANIVPELIATTASTPDLPADQVALGAVYALNAIAHGATLAHALDEAGTPDDQFRGAVRGVYAARVGGNDSLQPAADVRQAAAATLGRFRLTHSWFGLPVP